MDGTKIWISMIQWMQKNGGCIKSISPSQCALKKHLKHGLNGNFRILNWRYVNVPYFWPYVLGIFPYIGLKNRPNIYGIGTSNQSVPEDLPLTGWATLEALIPGCFSFGWPCPPWPRDDRWSHDRPAKLTYPLVNVYIAMENHYL